MKRSVILVLVAATLLTGCESLRRLGLTVERPTARLESVSLANLTFREAELDASILVDNPNAVGITLSGLSYRLEIEGSEFIAGDQPKGIAVAAFDESALSLPVRIGFENLFDTYESVRTKDEASYLLEVDLRFDLPILGRVTIPLRREGTMPVVRPPSVRVASLRLDSISIVGARLSLTMAVENPNGFALGLESLDYSFAVQERVWVDGTTRSAQRIPPNGSGELSTEFTLSFAALGRTVRDLLLGDDSIAYAFSANARIDPELELIPTVSFPFDREGEIELRRE